MSDELWKHLNDKLVVCKAEIVILAEQQRIAHAAMLAEYPILRAILADDS